MNKDIEKVLISEEEISSRCRLLASELEMNYKDLEEPLLIVGLLKGSVPFMAELMKRFTIPCEIDFKIGRASCRERV